MNETGRKMNVHADRTQRMYGAASVSSLSYKMSKCLNVQVSKSNSLTCIVGNSLKKRERKRKKFMVE